ncbi:MAG: proline--tRNA ligase [Candidatus Aceula meridiana]|nr:proline--tRNA ligase [Candidatus Aceula meridiana]
MRWTQFFIPTIKETPLGTEAISHKLLLRAGLVQMLTSGVYSYLPLGLRALRKVEKIINEEMNAIGARELFLTCLQPMDLWKKTGRDETLKDVMIRFEDKKGRQMCLGPTHEEAITDLVKNHIQSYKQLPLVLYQIQTKFRDEMRPRFGIVRACEFIMKDAYSFDRDKEGLEKNYQLMYSAYQKIFARCGLDVVIVGADSGAMGGDISHEYMVPAEIGEDEVLVCPACGHALGISEAKEGQACPKCKKEKLKKKPAIEIGHIFQLGTKYSKALDVSFLDEKGKKQIVIMGCYGIGVSRLLATIIEKNNDEGGIIWPKEITPFDAEILPLQVSDKDILQLAYDYEKELSQSGIDVLTDDREESPGKKFNDADLIGIPYRIMIGKRMFAEGKVEIKDRRTGEVIVVAKEDAVKKMKEILK